MAESQHNIAESRQPSGKYIAIRGAREHNLKNINLDIPRDKMVVITGVSGSGKSSLAFDTIYAEGQRRYIESLSAYARQFLEQMTKPDVDDISGLPPTISIEQRAGLGTPRSIVATTTEIYDYLRVLFARVGHAHCYKCNREISRQTAQQIIEQVRQMPTGQPIMILAPLIRGKKGTHREVFERIRREGFVRARVDGKVVEIGLKRPPALDRYKRHQIEVVVDRFILDETVGNRLADSLEMALRIGEGLIIVSAQHNGRWRDTLFSEHYACPTCGVSVAELSPRIFSFNSPYGACPACNGLGTKMELDVDLIIPQPALSLERGAIEPFGRLGHRMAIYYYQLWRDFAAQFEVDTKIPFYKLPADKKQILLHGTSEKDEERFGASFEGVIPLLERRFRDTSSDYIKRKIMDYMSELACPVCKGARLKPEPLAVRLGGLPTGEAGKNIHEVIQMTVEEAYQFFNGLILTAEEAKISEQILKEIKSRLRFMIDVGLPYLTLDRKSSTLAGGEAQRIKLASQVGSGLVGVCYVLDEPTIGLHPADNHRLINTLKRLRDLGNTVIVVEHDEDTIRASDYLIDIGPEAGSRGGNVVVAGPLAEVMNNSHSATIKYLRGEFQIPLPKQRRAIPSEPDKYLVVKGAREHNLQNIDVRIPLGCFCCVTGVSGSGKSTLVEDIIYKGLSRQLQQGRQRPGEYDEMVGVENIDKVIVIDQSPIGRTPRSNPATYTGVFDEVRKVFALTKEARMRGYTPGRFSFNLKGGRCEVCHGKGTKIIEMHFLPDVNIICEACQGKRYNRETLEVRYKGKNIAEVLEMEVSAAHEFFQNIPAIERWLRILDEIGLGYLTLGQSATTLSGGEAQRVKLAAELGKPATGATLYLLDEPTTGLHYSDINKLLKVLNQLVDRGNTVLVIEHNMPVVKTADYIIDMGPGGGEAGGRVVVSGRPEEVAEHPNSHTGRVLRKYLTIPERMIR